MFGDYKAPLPADGWERIEQSMNAAKAAGVIIRRRWYAGAAAAILVMLIGSLLFFQNRAIESVPLVAESSSPAPATRKITVNKGVPTPEPEATMQSLTGNGGNKQLFAARTRREQIATIIASSGDKFTSIKTYPSVNTVSTYFNKNLFNTVCPNSAPSGILERT